MRPPAALPFSASPVTSPPLPLDALREAVRIIYNIEDELTVDSEGLDEPEPLLDPLRPALLAAGIAPDAARALVARADWTLSELRAGREPPCDLNPLREAPWLFLTDAIILAVMAALGSVSPHERSQRLLELDLDPARAEGLMGNRDAELGDPDDA